MRRIAWGLAIVLLVALWATIDPEAGVRTWIDLDRERAASEARLAGLRAAIDALQAEADALETDPLAIEMAIRTDLGLARPGEAIVRVVEEGAGAHGTQ